jgi:NCAIR mutase (PurE)-related protein
VTKPVTAAELVALGVHVPDRLRDDRDGKPTRIYAAPLTDEQIARCKAKARAKHDEALRAHAESDALDATLRGHAKKK